ncbi:MAG: 2-phospho-L-lactate transferase [Gammaproteobacteria bacterium]|nr:2-phospho-L-lactate transferase [Gammaproteobacteria bacterium]
MNKPSGSVAVLSGGVGGAKLVLGLSRVLSDGQLTVIANTGDDFEHLGLAISPDLDTLTYTLAGEVNTETGWGLRDESWRFMEALAQLGGETWFRLGDRDLATHVERTRRLAAGERLTEITRDFCRRLGVATRILPMSDQAVRTRVSTDRGPLDFQHYFVREQAAPEVIGLDYVGASDSSPSDEVLEVLRKADLSAIIIAPSNPYLSIDPILAIPAIKEAIRGTNAPVVAVSPIVHGIAIKGPTAKIMSELGLTASADNIARHYDELLDGFILDSTDGNMVAEIETSALKVTSCDTIMRSLEDKIRVANATLEFADSLSR